MSVRRGSTRDWAFVHDLGSRTLASSRVRDASDETLRAGYARLLDVIAPQRHELFIAEEAGRSIGFVILLPDLPDEVTLQAQGFIAYMAVDPEHRRRGVGSQLLAAAEDEARRQALPYISLMVTEGNEPAMRLYERAGYRTERRLLCKPL